MQGSFIVYYPFKYITNKEPLEQNLCCHVSLLHKIVKPDETYDKCYILLNICVMHVTEIECILDML